ncbi:hypothetical protein B5X24_HaOG213348 [Helicoverpa armigera]|uniref:Uncharacterized protein n=1 Tax=Helicoverpa armigera TaxID=29058 RepID=A0A2W1BBE5_HELAM|nr:hypothetical protein B5X24_HaOG213348 [Helicoverpa armigera]
MNVIHLLVHLAEVMLKYALFVVDPYSVVSDHILKENPSSITLRMINLIRTTVAPRQISQSDRVCHACWLRFKRQALSMQQQDERRGLGGDEILQGEEVGHEVEQSANPVHVSEVQPLLSLASTDEEQERE